MHQGVGKSTFLRALQEEKLSTATDISTNGVIIERVKLTRQASSRFKKEAVPEVDFNVWDFGGQSVFHSTHKLFITQFALYVVMYDMSKPESCERVG